MKSKPKHSGNAAKRVKDHLPIPTECRYCGAEVKRMNNSKVYGKSFGSWPYVYACTQCDSYVGLHPSTNIPLGTLASKSLREARVRCKKPFQALAAKIGRSPAYKMLARYMGIPASQCHFGWFEEDQCDLAKEISETLLEVHFKELPTCLYGELGA